MAEPLEDRGSNYLRRMIFIIFDGDPEGGSEKMRAVVASLEKACNERLDLYILTLAMGNLIDDDTLDALIDEDRVLEYLVKVLTDLDRDAEEESGS